MKLIMENWRNFLTEKEMRAPNDFVPLRGADEVAVDSSGKKIYRTGWAFTDKDPSAPKVYDFDAKPDPRDFMTPEERIRDLIFKDYWEKMQKRELSQDQIDYMLGRGPARIVDELGKDAAKLLISVATMLEPTGQIADVVFHDEEKRMEFITTAEQLSNDIDGLMDSLDRATVADYGTKQQLEAKVDVFGNAAAVATGLLAFIPAAGGVISKVKNQRKFSKGAKNIKKATKSAEQTAAMIRNIERIQDQKYFKLHPALQPKKQGWEYFYKPGELNRDIAKARKTTKALGNADIVKKYGGDSKKFCISEANNIQETSQKTYNFKFNKIGKMVLLSEAKKGKTCIEWQFDADGNIIDPELNPRAYNLPEGWKMDPYSATAQGFEGAASKLDDDGFIVVDDRGVTYEFDNKQQLDMYLDGYPDAERLKISRKGDGSTGRDTLDTTKPIKSKNRRYTGMGDEDFDATITRSREKHRNINIKRVDPQPWATGGPNNKPRKTTGDDSVTPDRTGLEFDDDRPLGDLPISSPASKKGKYRRHTPDTDDDAWSLGSSDRKSNLDFSDEERTMRNTKRFRDYIPGFGKKKRK